MTLSDMVDLGAVITLLDPSSEEILADAHILPTGDLWYYLAFSEDQGHFLTHDQIETDGYNITFIANDIPIANVRPLEHEEEQTVWLRWQRHLNTPEGAAHTRSIDEMRKAAIKWT